VDQDEYLEQTAGRKTVEVRVAYIARLQPGDGLLLNERHPYVIQRIGRYASFENCSRTRIGRDRWTSAGELLDAAGDYPAEKEALGVVALEIAAG
jgi:ASC-1-like (ASCH) protein